MVGGVGGIAATSDTMVLNDKSMKENRVVHTEDQIMVFVVVVVVVVVVYFIYFIYFIFWFT